MSTRHLRQRASIVRQHPCKPANRSTTNNTTAAGFFIWDTCQLFDRAYTNNYSTLIETIHLCIYLVPFSSKFFVENWLILTYSTCVWHPCKRWSRSTFTMIFGSRKLESLGYCVALLAWFYIPDCDKQKQTDTRRWHILSEVKCYADMHIFS